MTGNAPWDEARRRDLLNAVAVIVSLPPMHADAVDAPGMSLGGVFATHGYGPGSPEEKLAREFLDSLSNLVAESTADLVPVGASSNPQPRPYETGPAAGGLPQVIVTVMHDARPILEDAALLWTLGQAAQVCLRRFGALLDRLKVRYWDQSSSLVFTEPMILGLCYAHIRDTYHPRANILLESHVRSAFPGYFDPEHPGGGEYYLVRATVGRKSYVYAVNSHADVTDHYLIEGTQLTMLPLPNWRDESYLPRATGGPVRAVTVHDRRTIPGNER